jgi:O-acetylserine/cysteine efflux transporter
MVITGGLCWAIANIFTKQIGSVNALSLVVWAALLASPPLIFASLLIEGTGAWITVVSELNWSSVGAVMFQSYANTIIGFGIWAILMRKYPTAMIAPFTLLVPVTGMLSAAMVLNEPLQWWKIVAGLLVLCGLACNLFGMRLMNALRSSH